jgi:hypothetical protein
VRYWKTTLAIVAALSVSLALAEDFKTLNGKEYKGVTVSRVEADGIVLRTKTGITKVYFTELPKDVQERFRYGSATKHPAEPAMTASLDEYRLAQRVEKMFDEREAILQGKHTPGPAESMVIREINFHKAFLAGLLSLPSCCSLSSGLVLNNKQ